MMESLLNWIYFQLNRVFVIKREPMGRRRRQWLCGLRAEKNVTYYIFIGLKANEIKFLS